jgi:hypothetical protein
MVPENLKPQLDEKTSGHHPSGLAGVEAFSVTGRMAVPAETS